MDFETDDFKMAMKRLGSDCSEDISLSIEDIIDIHDKMIDDFGGEYGIRDKGLLHSISEAPYKVVYGKNCYPTIYDKAAKYLFDLAHYQAFIDGNKRTALGVVNAYLLENGISLMLSASKAYNLVMNIANDKYKESEEIVSLLEENSILVSCPEIDDVDPDIDEDPNI